MLVPLSEKMHKNIFVRFLQYFLSFFFFAEDSAEL